MCNFRVDVKKKTMPRFLNEILALRKGKDPNTRQVLFHPFYSDKDNNVHRRFAINGDGHCMFDTFSFLYLMNAQDNKKMVKYDLIKKYGWKPDASTYLKNGKTKGNLMDILVLNHIDMLKKMPNTRVKDLQGIEEWFSNYKINPKTGSIIKYPRRTMIDSKSGPNPHFPLDTIAFLLKELMFKEDVTLCFHDVNHDASPGQFNSPTTVASMENEENIENIMDINSENMDMKSGYTVPSRITFPIPVCQCVLTELCECDCPPKDVLDLKSGKFIHAWRSGLHYEPIM